MSYSSSLGGKKREELELMNFVLRIKLELDLTTTLELTPFFLLFLNILWVDFLRHF